MPHTSAARWLSAVRHPARRRPGLAGSQVSMGLPTLTVAALESRGFRAVTLDGPWKKAWLEGEIGYVVRALARVTSWSEPTAYGPVQRHWTKGQPLTRRSARCSALQDHMPRQKPIHAHPELIAVPGKWALAPLAKPVTWQASTKSCLDGHRSSETPISIMRIVEFVLPHHERLVTTLLDQT
ncbi:hypothetical protein BN1723_006926 [Verticillium longisporum]|uniref:Uncharacterized protein n=1 Tax=Verticillium longisporum TaxID=100787 RepID=A0A0G4NIC7_VERLO|nr:hypothetical protein BN1723_006926 [Verticillium longisporum]